ncbi:anti-sigma factor C-terminal domain-containing protein [Bacillus sp. FJAT-45066]|uniref:anti-sigma factor C-terminal domain-containing protein n=1 Tax=Bacillus sp. FJAT-45066 TaxID=2011010 RepID=UPI00159704A3|nr:anti-sigma factor C-terminal domain-containing protein [Bacillus sp. FJAT-45066]
MFLNATIDKELRSKVGSEQKTVGKLYGSMFFDMVDIKREWLDGQYDINLSFVHPDFFDQEDPHLFPLEDVWNLRDEIWGVLDLLPEGTVSEVAISFDQLYSIDEVYSILSRYPDLEIVWYAMNTGSEVEHSNRFGPFLHAREGLFGLNENAIWDLMENNNSILVRGEGKRREEAFINSLEFVSEYERKGWIRSYFYGESIQKRLEYVKEHGSKSYGVCVTGPTKELLKLQNEERIQYASLGEVEWWNLHQKGISGRISN